MLRHFLIGLLVFSSQLAAQVPAPRETTPGEGTMPIDYRTAIVTPDSLAQEAQILSSSLGKLTGLQHRLLEPWQGRQVPQKIILEIDESLPASAYTLTITPKTAVIRGRDGEGILNGIQTFSQLLPIEAQPQQSSKIPCLTIKDSPVANRRILFIDTARHLFPVKTLKSLLSWMSYHKLNELHLHLNDDQGWRLESKQFPKLTGIGSLRNSTPPYTDHPDDENSEEYGGYYSQDNIKELLSHAARFHIKVIPGFSLPTHASAILAAYPELGNKDLPDYDPEVQFTWGTFPDTLAPSPETFAFLNTLFAEVATLFSAKEIRIHAPDVPWIEWQNSPRAQSYLKANKLASPAALQGHFLTKIDAILATHKRKRFDPTSVPAIDLSTYQRPSELELAEDPTREAATPMISIAKVYQFQKSPAMQATLWSPLVHDEDKLIYQLFPRLAAFAEAAWSAPSTDRFEQFQTRMLPILNFYQNANLEVADIYLLPKRAALQGTKVTTDMKHNGDRWPELAFDGDLDSYFQSHGGVSKGNHLTFEFPFPVEGKITFPTGGEEQGVLKNGILESSIDGIKWSAPVTLANGVAAIILPEGSKFLRLKVTAAQAKPILVNELSLAEKLLPPVVHDVRFTEFSQVDDKSRPFRAQLTFEANFADHPELRPQIKAMRQRFFSSGPRIMEVAGLIGQKDSAKFKIRLGEKTKTREGVLTINPDELRNLSAPDAEDLLLKHLITHFQDFSNDAPSWFATGIVDYLRKREIPDSTWARNFPQNPVRSEALSGHAESAAFLSWLVSQHTEILLQNACRSFRKGINNPLIWRGSANNKTLEELVREYQE